MPPRRRRRALAGLLLLVAAAAGCVAAPVRIEPATLARLKDEPAIHVVQYQSAVIGVRTRFGDAIRSLNRYSGPAADSTHRDAGMMRESGLTDPAVRLGERFLAAVTPRLGLENVRAVPAPPDSDALDTLRATIPAGLVLDFRTQAWIVRYDPNRLFSYYVSYIGRGRLIRLDGSQVIWQATCRAPFPAQAEPTLSELLANGGTLLRWKSEAEAERCATELVEHFVGGA
jgi:hypothetical protein